MSENFQNVDQLNHGNLLTIKQGKGSTNQSPKKHGKKCKCLKCKMNKNKGK